MFANLLQNINARNNFQYAPLEGENIDKAT